MKGAYKDECDRQTQELTEALERTIQDFGRITAARGHVPMLNAVAGALVTAQGAVLASVEDARIRKNLRREMEKALPKAVAAAIGKSGKTEILYMADKLQ